jgi:hypothetical protein
MRITWSGFLIAVLCCAGCGGSSSSTTNPNVVVVLISPVSGTLPTGQTQQFTATVNGTKNTSVTWTATAGSITANGLYTAPTSVQSSLEVTVTATSQGDSRDSAAAILTITPGPSTPSVNVTPSAATVNVFATRQFSAVTSNLANSAVVWQVNGVTGGTQSSGYITSNGLYHAPAALPSNTTAAGAQLGRVTVDAASGADPSISGSAAVTIHASNQDTQRVPIQLGTTGGNSNDLTVDAGTTFCCGGTLGALLQLDGALYILSTNHTLARSNSALLGEPVIQPGLINASCDSSRATVVGNLSAFYDLKKGPQPRIDAAIAQVVAGTVDAAGNILYLGGTVDSNGVPLSAPPAAGTGLAITSDLVGRGVAKSGSATGLTCSTIDSVGATVNVEYTPNCDGSGTPIEVTYSGQVEVAGGGFSAAGDSGSLIVTQDTTQPVALLFASSDSSTLGNPVSDVLAQFKDPNGVSPAFVGGNPHAVTACTLLTASPSSSLGHAKSPSAEALQTAVKVRDAQIAELLRINGVRAIGIGASYDQVGSPAILVFANNAISHRSVPALLEGIRTRIVEGNFNATSAAASLNESSRLEQNVSALSRSTAKLNADEYDQVKKVHSARVAEVMKLPGVQGVGIGRSFDSSAEAALVVFLIRGSARASIPPVIDGIRVRFVESSRFHTGNRNRAVSKSCSVSPSRLH